ncbi:MAG: permease [Planctomyces sp.]|nr:permease [Planctomyces sp.]
MVPLLLGALAIGLTLGLLGSGGSAITVPVLIYMVGHGTKESIAESMAIVGLISFAAAVPYARTHLIDWRSVVFFGIPGMLGTFVGAWLGGHSSDALQLVVFGAVLFLAAFFMLRKTRPPLDGVANEEEHIPHKAIWKIVMEGSVVGVVTGFVGVGGGFLIVPALVLLGKLPMRLAIGTSLVIIAAKSLVGFLKYQHHLVTHDSTVDLQTIAIFVAIGVVGSLVGKMINARLNQQVLKQVFAIFLVLLGGYLMYQEGGKILTRPRTESTAIRLHSLSETTASLAVTSAVTAD